MHKVLIVGAGGTGGIDRDKLNEVAKLINCEVIEIEYALAKLSTSTDVASNSMDELKNICLSMTDMNTQALTIKEHRGKHRIHKNKWRK